MQVAVLGLGYVGSVTAACLAEQGHGVVGVDPDRRKVDLIVDGRSPIVEPGLEALIGRVRSTGSLRATTDATEALEGSEVSIVCVGTPSRPNGSLDLRFVERVAGDIGGWLATAPGFHLVLVRSTVLPGTVEEVVIPVLEQASGRRVDRDFGVAMCPEFLREATAVRDFYDPPLTVVGGRDERSAALARRLFGFLDRPHHDVPIRVAEALKYASNAFHAVKITFANEMGRLCRTADVDAREVMRLLCQDDRLNLSDAYLRPGFSFGGSCLPKDVRALLHTARSADEVVPLLDSLLASNDVHLREAVRLVLSARARRVALFGLSFKPGTDDLRESPYVDLAETLLGKGVDLRIHDAHVNPAGVTGANRAFMEEHLPHLHRLMHDDPLAAVDGVDCALVSTAPPEVTEALVKASPPLVVDLSGALGPEVEALPGYRGVAW